MFNISGKVVLITGATGNLGSAVASNFQEAEARMILVGRSTKSLIRIFGDLAGSSDILNFIAEEISHDTYLNIMDQYRPAYQARKFPGLDRRLSFHEYQDVIQEAERIGLTRLDRY